MSVDNQDMRCAKAIGGASHRLIGLIQVMAALAVLGVSTVLPAVALAQDSLGCFGTDPVRHFTEAPGTVWVGNGSFLMTDYSDTLVIAPDSSGKALVIRRTLVNVNKGAVVSRGGGTVIPNAGDSSYAVVWTEQRYPDLTGTMRWHDGQWLVTFTGEWSAWSIRVRYDTPASFVAAVARTLGNFPPVEFAALTYRLIPASGK